MKNFKLRIYLIGHRLKSTFIDQKSNKAILLFKEILKIIMQTVWWERK